MGFLANGMVLMDVSEYVQRIVQGVVLILAVGFDCLSKDIGANSKTQLGASGE
jgi:ribose transport system permease protein